MTTTRQLASGLGGAIGSDFISNLNRLVFTEFDGKISRYDLVRSLDRIVFSGVATMPANASLSLMNGTSAQGGQIRWDHTSPGGTRVMRPQGTCMLAYLGHVNYNAVGYADLQQLAYSQEFVGWPAGRWQPVDQRRCVCGLQLGSIACGPLRLRQGGSRQLWRRHPGALAVLPAAPCLPGAGYRVILNLRM